MKLRRLRAERLKLLPVGAKQPRIAADTSSSGRGTIPVVDGAAAAVASLIASPIPLKSADAAANASVTAIT